MQQHPSFSFHIEGVDPAASPAVPANVLIQVLQRAQQAFDLIGMYVEGREVRQRARVPAATSKRFQLVCELPTQGSYCMPVTLGAEPDLADFPILVRAYGIFHDVVAAVPLHMPESIASLLPDLSIRRRVLDAIRGTRSQGAPASGMAPRVGAAGPAPWWNGTPGGILGRFARESGAGASEQGSRVPEGAVLRWRQGRTEGRQTRRRRGRRTAAPAGRPTPERGQSASMLRGSRAR